MTIAFWFRYSGGRVLLCAVCPRDPCTVYVIYKAAEDSAAARTQIIKEFKVSTKIVYCKGL
ncbi:hypothetical protein ACE6H2_007135 [Prunus campanulata]